MIMLFFLLGSRIFTHVLAERPMSPVCLFTSETLVCLGNFSPYFENFVRFLVLSFHILFLLFFLHLKEEVHWKSWNTWGEYGGVRVGGGWGRWSTFGVVFQSLLIWKYGVHNKSIWPVSFGVPSLLAVASRLCFLALRYAVGTTGVGPDGNFGTSPKKRSKKKTSKAPTQGLPCIHLLDLNICYALWSCAPACRDPLFPRAQLWVLGSATCCWWLSPCPCRSSSLMTHPSLLMVCPCRRSSFWLYLISSTQGWHEREKPKQHEMSMGHNGHECKG